MIGLLGRLRDRHRRMRAQGDSGFMLVFVLAITTVVTVMVTSTLVIAAGNVVPAQRSAYSQAAEAAAQGALQAFIAYADANCANGNSSVASCTLPENVSGMVPILIAGVTDSDTYKAYYSWDAYKDPSNRYFRVHATGKVVLGGLTVIKNLIGDVVGGSSLNLLDYGLVTGFESQSSATVLADWPKRTIQLNCAATDAADVPLKQDKCTGPTDTTHVNTMDWGGASPGTAPGKVAVCNATFDAKGGRSNNLPNGAPDPYVDWTESGTASNNYTNYQPCQTSWGNQTKLLAPANPADGAGGYFSQDALLLSNSYPGGTGPLFNQPVYTGWQYTSNDAGLCGTASGQNYRSFNLVCAGWPLEVGGSPAPTSTYPNVTYESSGPQVPVGTPTINASTACLYTGPTRVVLSGDNAIITSPQTTAAWVAANATSSPSQCYAGAGANGMAAQTVSLTTPVVIRTIDAANNGKVPPTTPAIAHGSSGWPTTGQAYGTAASTNNSVFYLTNGTAGSSSTTAYAVSATPGGYTPANNDNPSTKTDGAWSPKWTSDTTTSCNAPPAYTDLRFAYCYIPKGTFGDPYSWLKSQVQTAIAASPSSYTSAASLQALVNSFTSQGNSADAGNASPSHADYTSHKWNVSVAQANGGGCTQSSGVAGTTSDSPVSAPSSDPFYANTAGNVHVAPSTDTSCFTATVTLQVGTCNVALVLGVCLNLGNYVWGNGTALLGGGQSVAQFAATFTVAKTTTTTTTTIGTSTFPNMADVTQYNLGTNGTFGSSGPGDLYIEGTTNHTMSVVGDNDLIITGTLTASAPTAATVQIVGRNNIRVYHPVQCLDTNAADIAATSAGFCPNDITGLYNSVPPTGEAPYQQYVNMRSDLASLTIHGAVIAMGNADESINCPQPPNGGGVCGGEFTVDNYLRGSSLGQITVVGTLAMSHHAPVGQEWQVADANGVTSRPWSGYQMAEQYQNLKAIFAGVGDVNGLLQTTFTSSSLWHVLSVSEVTS